MRHLFWIFFICFGTLVSSGQNEKITQDLQKFKEIKAFDGISVNLIRSSVNKAVITGANTKSVAIVNNEGVLKIRMEVGKIFSGYRTFIDVYYTEKLLVIDVNEDARITSDDIIKQDVL
ncbi:MAG: GIN domain-containing protein, partial [Flavobacteriales bacterium]